MATYTLPSELLIGNLIEELEIPTVSQVRCYLRIIRDAKEVLTMGVLFDLSDTPADEIAEGKHALAGVRDTFQLLADVAGACLAIIEARQ